MAFMEWTENLTLHIPSVDEQHKKLVGLINELDEAVQSGHGDALLEKIVVGLLEYTRYHFSYEEKLLSDNGYPAFDGHKKEHDSLTEKVVFIETMVRNKEDFHGDQLLNFLKIWLQEHILGNDKQYAPFLTAKGVG